MENLTLIGSMLLIHLLATISPGPDFIVAVKNSVTYSRRTGIYTAIGFGLGISVHITYCIVGLAVIISKYVILFNIIKYVGVCYLIYIGARSVLAKSQNINIEDLKKDNDLTNLAAIRSGFLTNILNPKATLFFLSIFSYAISEETSLHINLIIAFSMVTITCLWFILVSILFTHKKILNLYNKYQNIFNKIFGGFLILLGIKIILI